MALLPKIESYIYSDQVYQTCDTVAVHQGVDTYTVHVGEPLCLSDWLDALKTKLETATANMWTCNVQPSGKVLMASNVAFTLALTESTAQCLGFTDGTANATSALTHTGSQAPAAMLIPIGVEIEPPRDSTQVDLQQYRHNRSTAFHYNNHQLQEVTAIVRASDLTQNPAVLFSGRLRVWPTDDTSAYDAFDHPGGYVDGFVAASKLETLDSDASLTAFTWLLAIPLEA